MRLPHKFAWSSSAMGWCVPAFLLCCGPMLAATKKLPLRPLNLNTATAFELQQVPGIGPSTADKILKMRKSYEAFKSLADLPAIEGFGPKRKKILRKYITLGKSVAPKKQVSCVIHVADNLEIAATRGAEKLESNSSLVELKPNNRPEDRPLQNRENPAGNRKY
jgi:competence ComEA-like helix-hairpin-helix protein